jgi:hypothetical protein
MKITSGCCAFIFSTSKPDLFDYDIPLDFRRPLPDGIDQSVAKIAKNRAFFHQTLPPTDLHRFAGYFNGRLGGEELACGASNVQAF